MRTHDPLSREQREAAYTAQRDGCKNLCLSCWKGFNENTCPYCLREEVIKTDTSKLGAAVTFSRWCAEQFLDGRDIDGGEAQERALELGLIEEAEPPEEFVRAWGDSPYYRSTV